MKKITEKLLDFFEKELSDEESRSRIQQNILAPSLSLLRDEIDKSGTDNYIISHIHHLLWPIFCILTLSIIFTLATLSIQLYLITR
tara:strand:+ start:663 stop:920 length:258 start_codon:yes stop_codon:yes gene_type:complete